MFRNKKVMVLVALLFAISVILSGCGGAPTASTPEKSTSVNQEPTKKPIELKYATYIAAGHYMAAIDKQAFKRIEDQTKGQVKIAQFYDGTLVQPTQWYQELIKGSADIAQGPAGSEKARFALEGAVSSFSYGISDPKALLEFFQEMYKKTPELQAEFKDVIPLSRIMAGTTWIHTVKKPIRSVADLKGLNIKVADDLSTALVKAVGANPIKLPISETYGALEKGTIDGVITGADPLKTFKFAEVVKYSAELPYSSPWLFSKVMNKDVWNKLSPDIQKVFAENSAWWEEQLIVEIVKQTNQSIELTKKEGNEIIQIPQVEKDKIVAILEADAKKIAAALDAKGLKGTELLNSAREVAKTKMK